MQKEVIIRNNALELVAEISLSALTSLEREEILIDIFSENDEYEKISDFNDPIYDSRIKHFLKRKFRGVTNEYLAFLLKKEDQSEIEVIGELELLKPCPCCFFLTLDERGNYNICPVCRWEDDGSDILDRYSSVNRTTLKEARANFSEIGVANSILRIPPKEKISKYPRLEA